MYVMNAYDNNNISMCVLLETEMHSTDTIELQHKHVLCTVTTKSFSSICVQFHAYHIESWMII